MLVHKTAPKFHPAQRILWLTRRHTKTAKYDTSHRSVPAVWLLHTGFSGLPLIELRKDAWCLRMDAESSKRRLLLSIATSFVQQPAKAVVIANCDVEMIVVRTEQYRGAGKE